jgi:hypothetical protein
MTASPQGVEVLRNATLFSLTRSSWSNYRKADRSKVSIQGYSTDLDGATTSVSDAATKRVNVTKKLVESEQLDNVRKYMNEVYDWCLKHCMPSTAIRKGIYFVKNNQVPVFEEKLTHALDELRSTILPSFLEPNPNAVLEDGSPDVARRTFSPYELAKEAAKKPTVEGGLGELYDEDDYPTVEELRKAFNLRWSWLQLSVPDELPEEVRVREVSKLKASFLEAQEEIKLALRAGFKDLVSHAIERLTPGPDGKRKVFCESTFTKFNEFFETFNARNLMEDAELEAVVEQAKEIMKGLPSVDDLRSAESRRLASLIKQNEKKGNMVKVAELQKQLVEQEKADAQVLESTVAQFAKVDEVLAPLVLTPTRRFNFEEE